MTANSDESSEATPRVPRFTSLEEEVEFWDTHSPLDFPDYWKDVKRKTKRHQPLGHILGVRLDARVIDQLSAVARGKRIGPSTLARMWLMERLEREHGKLENNSSSERVPASS